MPGKKIPAITKKTARKKTVAKPGRMPMAEGHAAIELWLDGVKPELQPLVRRLDRLVLVAMPDAVCAIKWGVPFYGLPGKGWIAAINSFKAHVKLLFFKSSLLKPRLPAGKGHNAIDFHSGEELNENEKQVKAWLRQAANLPGWNLKNFPRKAT